MRDAETSSGITSWRVPARASLRRVLQLALAVIAVAGFAAAFRIAWPQARQAGAVLLAQHDPVALSEARLAQVKTATLIDETERALAAGDSDLAASFVELATARGTPLPADLSERVVAAVHQDASVTRTAARFAGGFVTGEGGDLAALSGTVAGDLFVFGDIRDLLREGSRLASGEEADRLLLGLAAAGIAVTAATYVSVGTAAPARAGLSLVKDARKAGRLGAGLAGWAGRSAIDVVDGPMLRGAMADASVMRPAASLAALRGAVRADKVAALIRAAKDAGRIGEKAGTRGALETLRLADEPADLARAARLAEGKGTQTRALLKLFGRGALVLAAGAFDLAVWLFGAAFALLGLLASIKATTERLTEALLRRAKLRRARRAAVRQARSGLAAAPVIG